MSKYPSQMQDKFNLRFPDGMRDAIAERAKANGRSMNSEIVQILEDAL
ncbi:Arc family DNA-binding protein, partial [Salmonella enterica subsp. enterica serovar Cerro]|nr:Arc family DNA-binding protein [Salmonella enterica subsp. enterica serovar Cerro]